LPAPVVAPPPPKAAALSPEPDLQHPRPREPLPSAPVRRSPRRSAGKARGRLPRPASPTR
jgi:hypothetical protein